MPTRDTDKGENDKGDKSGDETKMNESLYKTGFYFSPEEHVKLAMRLQHPASEFTLVPAQGKPLCLGGCAGRRADCCAWSAGLLLPGSSL